MDAERNPKPAIPTMCAMIALARRQPLYERSTVLSAFTYIDLPSLKDPLEYGYL